MRKVEPIQPTEQYSPSGNISPPSLTYQLRGMFDMHNLSIQGKVYLSISKYNFVLFKWLDLNVCKSIPSYFIVTF